MDRLTVLITTVLFATGCSTTSNITETANPKADASCDILYAAVEGCYEFGRTVRDANDCPAFGTEVRASFDRGIEGLGEEFLDWIGEYCIEHCESGVNGDLVAAVDEVCPPLENDVRK